MRIFQAMAGAPYGGAENFFVRLALAFQRAGVEQRIAIRTHPRRAEVLHRGGIEPLQLRFGGLFDFQTRRLLRQELKNFRPDVVLTWMNRATRHCPAGSWAHVGRLGGYYPLKHYRDCDHLIGNTQDIVDYLVRSGWPRERAHYLPNFVDATRTAPVSRRDLFTPQGAPVVLALGRLHVNKAFDILIRAMARVPDAYLWLAGEGPERADLERLAESLAIKPRVRFLGWRDDIAALFASADLFVCPSRHEPLGNVVIEAWAHEVAVIAAATAGPAALIDAPTNGILVPIDATEPLSQAIRGLLADADARARIAHAGYAAYQAHFTEAMVVDQYLRFFERVAEKGSCAASPES